MPYKSQMWSCRIGTPQAAFSRPFSRPFHSVRAYNGRMRPRRPNRFCFFALLLAAICPAGLVHGITIETVPIGNVGNAGDTRYAGVGSVTQFFAIGKTEVTNEQYVAMLNAVAASDPYGLYNTNMAALPWGGIVRIGLSGHYGYTIKSPALSGGYTYDRKPVVYVSYGDVIRFANWLHNGQPTGAENSATTEDGAYTLNGATSDAALVSVTRNANARWWLPSENEWYKAAYFNPNTASYFEYPTSSNSVPNNNLPSSDTANSVNYDTNHYTTGNSNYPMTDAGAYSLSISPFGTHDQGGNVFEWNERLLSGAFRAIRGGSWSYTSADLQASSTRSRYPTDENSDVGFRIASIPDLAAAADYSGDGTVDASDYVVWRKRSQPIGDYTFWRQQFIGVSSADGVSAYGVPEQSSMMIIIAMAAILLRSRRSDFAPRR
jgi:sulfatase modifying factor 1